VHGGGVKTPLIAHKWGYTKASLDPHLDQAFIVWSPYIKGEMESLENVQEFALRVRLKP